MYVEMMADASVRSRNHNRFVAGDKADVTDETLIKDFINGGVIILASFG